MKGKITIGSKKVEMVANAATPFFFKQVFAEDFFVVSQKLDNDEIGASVDVFSKIGFIMSKQAEKADINSLTVNDYIDWLSQFEPMDIASGVVEIVNFYMGQTKPTVESKN